MQEKQAEADKARREDQSLRRKSSKGTLESTEDVFEEEEEERGGELDGETTENGEEEKSEEEHNWEGEGSGNWVPGQGVYVDHAAIMDIIIHHLSYPGECPCLDLS